MKYYPDFKGTGAVLSGPLMSAAVAKVASEGQRFAESISPRRTGEYARSFRVVTSTAQIDGQKRSIARIENTSDHATAVEWGNGASRVLHRTLEEIRRQHDPKGR